MEYSYKFRLYPNTAQQAQIGRMFGCCRYVYNHFLALRESVYRTEQRTLNYNACATMLPAMKKELSWLTEVDSTALQSAVRDLDNACQNFFR